MGEPDAARVDIGALLDVAAGYQAVADALDDATRTHLAQLAFRGAVAGRAHAAGGEAVRGSVAQLGEQLRIWARAGSEIAAVLGASTDRYLAADARGAVRLG